MKENLLIDKSIAFAARIVKLHQHLVKNKKETVISKQIVRIVKFHSLQIVKIQEIIKLLKMNFFYAIII